MAAVDWRNSLLTFCQTPGLFSSRSSYSAKSSAKRRNCASSIGISTTGIRRAISNPPARRSLQHVPIAKLLRIRPREVPLKRLHDFAELLSGCDPLKYLSHQAAAVTPEFSSGVNVGKEDWKAVALEYVTCAPIRPEHSWRKVFRFWRGKPCELQQKKTAAACTSRASCDDRMSRATQSSSGTISHFWAVGAKTFVRRRI